MKQIVQIEPDAIEMALDDYDGSNFIIDRNLYGYFQDEIFWNGVKRYIEKSCGEKFIDPKKDILKGFYHNERLIEKYWKKYNKVRDKFIFHKGEASTNIYSYQFLDFGNVGNVIGVIKYEPIDLFKACNFTGYEDPSVIYLTYVYKHLNQRKEGVKSLFKKFLPTSEDKKMDQVIQEIFGTASIYAKSPYFSPVNRNEVLKKYLLNDQTKKIFQHKIEKICHTLPMLCIEGLYSRFGHKVTNKIVKRRRMQQELSERDKDLFDHFNECYTYFHDRWTEEIGSEKLIDVNMVQTHEVFFRNTIISWLFIDELSDSPFSSSNCDFFNDADSGCLNNTNDGKIINSLAGDICSIFLKSKPYF